MPSMPSPACVTPAYIIAVTKAPYLTGRAFSGFAFFRAVARGFRSAQGAGPQLGVDEAPGVPGQVLAVSHRFCASIAVGGQPRASTAEENDSKVIGPV